MSNGKKNLKLQIITLGDHTVGKTSILKRFNDGTFSFTTYTTIGVDFVSKVMKVGDESVYVKLWDTAGQERFHTITHNFYKQCQGVLLVFDVRVKSSLTGINRWMEHIRNHADPNVVRYLIANKTDVEKREVPKEEGEELAAKYNMKYYDCLLYTSPSPRD
eukprot:TRINITY_DN7454_c0_g1_i4.p1 TRINITY_DN7454_c0_g1~~TRINITY_DN7454_c0_g1_i4.p1  ORF type:complete len:161 (+),score=43.27 TRINITY_DN7454_c0_g1_i4:2-484(+)